MFYPKEIKTKDPAIRQLFELMDVDPRSYGEVAEHAGVHRVMLSTWKSGKRSPKLSLFAYVAEALGYRIILWPIKQPLPFTTDQTPIKSPDQSSENTPKD